MALVITLLTLKGEPFQFPVLFQAPGFPRMSGNPRLVAQICECEMVRRRTRHGVPLPWSRGARDKF